MTRHGSYDNTEDDEISQVDEEPWSSDSEGDEQPSVRPALPCSPSVHLLLAKCEIDRHVDGGCQSTCSAVCRCQHQTITRIEKTRSRPKLWPANSRRTATRIDHLWLVSAPHHFICTPHQATTSRNAHARWSRRTQATRTRISVPR